MKLSLSRTSQLLLLVALAIRLAVMPFSLHSDLLFIHQYPTFLLSDGVWNIYQYIQETYRESQLQHGWNYYPPLTYITIVAWQYTVAIFDKSFSSFLSAYAAFELKGGQTLAQFFSSAHFPNLFRHLFLMKFPYLLFELLIVVAYLRIPGAKSEKSNRLFFWLLNPLVIYATYAFGQMDMMPAALTLLAVTTLGVAGGPISFQRKGVCVLLLSIAASFKLYPLLLLPPTILLIEPLWKRRILLSFISVLPLVVLTIPFVANGFNPLTIWYPTFVVSSVEVTLVGRIKQVLFVVLYGAACALSYYNAGKPNVRTIAGVFILILGALLTLTHFTSLHYLLWLLPFLPLYFASVRRLYLLSWVLFICLLGFKVMARQHQLGLFVPVDPLYFSSLPSLVEFIGRWVPRRLVSDSTYIIYHSVLLTVTVIPVLGLIKTKRKYPTWGVLRSKLCGM